MTVLVVIWRLVPFQMATNPNSLVGQTIKVGDRQVIVRERIGEGGYAWVFRAEDRSGMQYALKWVNCLTPERFDQFKIEATILKTLPEHPNIVKLFGAEENAKKLTLVLLYEFCPATAISMLSTREMTKEEILIFFTACAEATAFLHAQKPAILHRDLKPENLLVALDGTPKLCDFGSCTRTVYQIKTVSEINTASEDIERNTTQNYRAPEMVDLYKRVEVGTAADVWALACTLYKLIYRDDLYKQDERLPILQGKLRLPADADEGFAAILTQCIQVDPKKRPTAEAVAGTAKLMRGAKTKIEVPQQQPRQVQQEQPQQDQGSKQKGKQNGEGGWKWANPLAFVQEQYRSWAASGAVKWSIKATFASGDPPAAKYVRRIILASIRRTDTAPTALTDYLLLERPWQTDARIAAKVMYLILLLVQYETSLDQFIPITVKTDQVIAHFATDKGEKYRAMIDVVNHIGTVVRTKVMLHATHKELHGNLAVGEQGAGPTLESDLVRYLPVITQAADSILKASVSSKDFCVAVMAQPVVDEMNNAVKLLSFVKKSSEADKALSDAAVVIQLAKKIPFVQSAVSFPNTDDNEPPYPRFAVRK